MGPGTGTDVSAPEDTPVITRVKNGEAANASRVCPRDWVVKLTGSLAPAGQLLTKSALPDDAVIVRFPKNFGLGVLSCRKSHLTTPFIEFPPPAKKKSSSRGVAWYCSATFGPTAKLVGPKV